MKETLSEAVEFLGQVIPQLDENTVAEYQAKLQANPDERVADLLFDEPDSEVRKAAGAFLREHGTDLTIGQVVELWKKQQ